MLLLPEIHNHIGSSELANNFYPIKGIEDKIDTRIRLWILRIPKE